MKTMSITFSNLARSINNSCKLRVVMGLERGMGVLLIALHSRRRCTVQRAIEKVILLKYIHLLETTMSLR